jgi:aminoglycoside 6'-N-acetyltransferase
VVTARLRPLEETDLPFFDQVYSSRESAGEYQWFGFSSPGRGLAEMGALGREGGRLTAVVEGRIVGSTFWFRRDWGLPDTSWCWEVAVHIVADQRRRGFGTQCLTQLMRYLFDHTLAWRIQAIADVANTPSQRMLARTGFTQEGRLRAPQWREGGWHDHFIYSLLRGDPLP